MADQQTGPREPSWAHELVRERDGSHRVLITGEDGVAFPVGRQLSRGQAELLVQAVDREHRQSGRTVAEVIRDYRFMASTILAVKGHQS